MVSEELRDSPGLAERKSAVRERLVEELARTGAGRTLSAMYWAFPRSKGERGSDEGDKKLLLSSRSLADA